MHKEMAMTKMNACRIALAILFSVTLSAQGRKTIEFVNKQKTTHYFDNAGEWKCGTVNNVLPVAGDEVQIAAYFNACTLYITNDTTLAARKILVKGGYTATYSPGTLRFVGDGCSFLMPSLPANPTDADGNAYSYNANPFVLGVQNGGGEYSLIYSGGFSSYAPFKMTNPDFTCGGTASEGNWITFTRGTFNFCDPEGVANGSTLTIGVQESIPVKVTLAPEATLRMCAGVLSTDSANVDVVAFKQRGAVEATTSFKQAGGTWEIDGGTVTTPSLIFNRGYLTATNAANLSLGTYTQNGGTMTLAASATQSVSSYTQNGGTARLATGSTLTGTGGVGVSGATVPKLIVDGGTFTANGSMTLGGATDGRLIVSNGSFAVKGADGIQVGAGSNGSGTIEIVGGALTTPRVRLARASGSGDTTLRQTGGYLELTGSTYGYVMFLQGVSSRAGTHTIELNGGIAAMRYIVNDQPGNTAATLQLLANGGTLKALTACDSTSSPFLKALTYMKLGDKGLTFDTAGNNVYIVQDMTNQDGASGLLKKVGSGTLTYIGASDVANTVVAGGTLLVSDASTTLSTALTVTNGATFSLVGSATGVTLSALTVTNATLALDAGDVITVTGPVSVNKLTLNWSSVPSVATPFLVVSGEMDDATKANIRRALFANALAEGTHAAYSFDYDAGTGYTTVSATVAPTEPLTDSVTWTGTGAWATPANWSGNATPTDAQIASFTSVSAGKTVAVAAGDKAGALAFGADGYTLTGTGPLTIKGEIGAAQIAANAGATTIDVPLNLDFMTTVPVAAGASLALAKPVSGGGIAKYGTGKLTLGTANVLENGISSADGILEVKAAGALGASIADVATLSGGTVSFAEPTQAPMTIPVTVNVNAPASTDLVVAKTDTDVTIDGLTITQGAFCKRGVGKLTVNVPDNTTFTIANGNGSLTGQASTWYANQGLVFPADGTAPDGSTGLYPGFSVAEGELAFVGTGAGAQVNMTASKVFVGLYVSSCAVQPVLTIDNVYCYTTTSEGWYLGHNVGGAGVAVTNPVLRIINGGTMKIASSQIGYGSTTDRSFVTMAATNGTFHATGSNHYVTRLWNNPKAKAYYRFKDSRMYLDGAVNYIGGGIDLDFDNSVFSKSSGGTVALTGQDARARGTLVFRNGSVFAYGGFTETSQMNAKLTFAFDDAELQLHKDRASATLATSTRGYVHYEMRGAGAVLKPASGATYTISAPLEGEGGLVVDGEGTVAFGANTAQFTGALDVRQGTADFSANGGAAAFTAAKGAGTVRGATMGAVTLPVMLLGDGTVSNVLTLADCTLGGRVTVDFGRTSETAFTTPYPRDLLVARYSGTTAPAAVGWRMAGSGLDGYRGKFTFADGEVRMTVLPAGFAIDFR